MRLASHLRVFSLAVCCAGLVSCQNGAGSSRQSSGNSPYVSNFGSDGGYNPYPGQPGYVQNDSGGSGNYVPPPSYSTPPAYTPPPPRQQPADPYAFSAPSSSSSSSSSSPKRSSTTASAKPKPKAAAKKSTASKSGSYKVASGDTLYGIARKRGTTVAKLKAANKLTSDLIRPGQSLRIP